MRNSRSGFTVASLLLLTAVVAVFAAGIMSVRTMEPRPDPDTLCALGLVGLVFGTIAGCCLGLSYGTEKAEIWLGGLEGALFGTLAFVLLGIPSALPVFLSGAAVLVVFALVIRLFSGKSSEEPPVE